MPQPMLVTAVVTAVVVTVVQEVTAVAVMVVVVTVAAGAMQPATVAPPQVAIRHPMTGVTTARITMDTQWVLRTQRLQQLNR